VVHLQRIAICDDERKSIDRLRMQIEKFADDMGIGVHIEEYTSGENLMFYWDDVKAQADILYLDIHMPGIDGIAVAEKLRKLGCTSEIIFYTKSLPEVFDAFDVDAFHYIIKNETSISKQKEIFKQALKKSNGRDDEFVTFKFAGEHRTILVGDIKYFTIEHRVATVHFGRDSTFEFYLNLDKIEEMLFGQGFLRIARGILINMAYVKSRTRVDILTKSGETIAIGRPYRATAAEELAYYFRETEGG
jgi:DNA-binding LytR/AlgR family response regulator